MFQLPQPSEIDAALEALPAIGPDGVEVTATVGPDGRPVPGQFDIAFSDARPLITVPDCWTVLPLEVLEDQLSELEALLDPSAPAPTLPTGYEDANAYRLHLEDELQLARISGDIERIEQLRREILRFAVLDPSFDHAATVAAMTALFPARAAIAAVT